jgi:diphosphomevalonate decarboxylase
MRSTAVAHPNIALVKYWGKRNVEYNIPAAGSLSVTLQGLETETHVEFDESLAHDELKLDGDPVGSGRMLDRVENFLGLVRGYAGTTAHARVQTRNNFPTGAGLASSASGFAALTVAACDAAGLDLSRREMSALARRGSGSAARSIFGGYVEMKPGEADDGSDAVAKQIAEAEHWDLRCFVGVTAEGKKKVGSTEGMMHTERSSPYYDAWIDQVPRDIATARQAVRERDFDALAEVAESSCLQMHASAIAAEPGIIYWNGATVELMKAVRDQRGSGLPMFFTVDAGPHVKVFCPKDYEDDVSSWLADRSDVIDVYEAVPGPGAHLVQ